MEAPLLIRLVALVLVALVLAAPI
ncbi:hypothetical protein S1OALGB6SA_2222 [Olavius algarvensis spirochete endosymbiont]|nr:hypothetical protein S1OALGB6SA_2222 [Olavius algarvensis spirochete endosymbiont]